MILLIGYVWVVRCIGVVVVLSNPLSRALPLDVSHPGTKLSANPVPRAMQVLVEETYPLAFLIDAAFINVVEALRELAKQDFEGWTPLGSFRSVRFPHPTIAITSHSLAAVRTKYAIWGLYMTLTWLSHPGMAMITRFMLVWNRRIVGGINYGGTFLNAEQNYNSTVALRESAQHQSTGFSEEDISNNKNLTNSHFAMDFTYFGPEGVIEKVDMQSAVLNTLVQAAQYASNTVIDDRWRPSIQDHECHFAAKSFHSDRSSGLNFYWLIEATAAAANYFTYNDIYRGLTGIIKVDGEGIGQVTLFSASRGNAASNQSIETS